ncbi:MAG: hypothetical protein JJE45_00850 [Prolixibacteraceae bacterium]|nr:hypothetical protein [Prolixibacteraceae bacterium]
MENLNLEQKIAKVISILFDPFIVPTWGFLLLLLSPFYFSTFLIFQAKLFILAIVFVSTFVVPVFTMWLIKYFSHNGINFSNRKDRLLLFLITAVSYYIGYSFLRQMIFFSSFKIFLISAAITILLLLLVSSKWKISVQTAGIGGLTGIYLAVCFRFSLNAIFPVCILFLICGMIGTSRLILKRHTPAQVYAGFFLGFITNYAIVMYF